MLIRVCIFFLLVPVHSLSFERTSEVLVTEKIQPMRGIRNLREISEENLDPVEMFESAVHLLNDIQPDLMKLSSSLSKKRSVDRPNYLSSGRLPNCKDENSARCHRTRHMKRKHPHGLTKLQKYNRKKRKEKRTVVAVKNRIAHIRAKSSEKKQSNSTHTIFDYEDMIFTPTNAPEIKVTQRGAFDSVIELLGRTQTTLNPPSTREGFEASVETHTVRPTDKTDSMTGLHKVAPQFLMNQPIVNGKQNNQQVQIPQVFQPNRYEILQPNTRNQIPQSFQIPQAFQSNSNQNSQLNTGNQISQPNRISQAVQFKENQNNQPPEINRIKQPIQIPQVYQSHGNHVQHHINGYQIPQHMNGFQIPQNANGYRIPQNAQIPKAFQTNSNQIRLPTKRNQISKPFEIQQVYQSNRNQILKPSYRISDSVKWPQPFETIKNPTLHNANRNQIPQSIQKPQVFQPTWNESRDTRSFPIPKQFKQDQQVENKNRFLPKFQREPIKNQDRNSKNNSWSNTDFTKPGIVEGDKAIFKNRMNSEKNTEGFQNDIVKSTENIIKRFQNNIGESTENIIKGFQNNIEDSSDYTHFITRSPHVTLNYDDSFKESFQEGRKNTNSVFLKTNRTSQIREINNGGLNREGIIELEISNANREAEIRQAHLENYLNYNKMERDRRRNAVNQKLKAKSSRNPNERRHIEKEKKIIGNQLWEAENVSPKPSPEFLRDLSKKENLPIKSHRYSKSESLHNGEYPTSTYLKDNYEQANVFLRDPISDIYSDELNYEEPPTYDY